MELKISTKNISESKNYIVESEMLQDIYKYVKAVYFGTKDVNEAAHYIENRYKRKADSFKIYCNKYKNMLLGKPCNRNMSIELHRLFLDGIYKEYGKDALRNALKSYLAYIEYRKTKLKKEDKAQQDIILYEEYAKKI